MRKFETVFFDEASSFIRGLPESDRAKTLATISTMVSDFDAVYTKLLRSPIRELIVRKCRILFFIKGNTIYFVSGFIKKSQKTPLREIEQAEAVYKMMK